MIVFLNPGYSSAWLERLLREQEVVRSNRIIPTIKNNLNIMRKYIDIYVFYSIIEKVKCQNKSNLATESYRVFFKKIASCQYRFDIGIFLLIICNYVNIYMPS